MRWDFNTHFRFISHGAALFSARKLSSGAEERAIKFYLKTIKRDERYKSRLAPTGSASSINLDGNLKASLRWSGKISDGVDFRASRSLMPRRELLICIYGSWVFWYCRPIEQLMRDEFFILALNRSLATSIELSLLTALADGIFGVREAVEAVGRRKKIFWRRQPEHLVVSRFRSSRKCTELFEHV